MTDYHAIQDHCQNHSEISESLLEHFLLPLVNDKVKIDREFSKLLAPYRHITRQFQEGWVDMFETQYIAYKLLGKGGLIKRYLNHSSLRHLTAEEMAWLEQQAGNPWRFSFSEITGRPAEHFFEMKDVFTQEPFLLYSPGVTDTLLQHGVSLWFNLLGYNGKCMQSFGPIGAWQGFEPGDIPYFTSALSPGKWDCSRIVDEEEILSSVDKNPVPYMMLISGAAIPASYHKEDRIIQAVAEYEDDAFEPTGFDNYFRIAYAHGVYRLSLKQWEAFPHYSTACYEEKTDTLFLYSMTDRGFDELVARLTDCGYELSPNPDFRVNMSMATTAGNLLKKESSLNRYESLFSVDPPENTKDEVEKINRMMALILPEVNAGKQPDIEAAARKAGVDVETARELMKSVMDKIGGMGSR